MKKILRNAFGKDYFVTLSHSERTATYSESKMVIRALSGWDCFSIAMTECKLKEAKDQKHWTIYNIKII